MVEKKQFGRYYTITNPFKNKIFIEWFSNKDITNNDIILEPFAGENNIVRLIKEIGIDNQWKCFDIIKPNHNEAPEFDIEIRDTIKSFPNGYKIAITNPPYLAKVSASRNKIPYPETAYDDLYKLCLNKLLDNCEYAGAIIPESFITAELFHNRLEIVISLPIKMFDDTECPVCLALFSNKKRGDDFQIYRNEEFLGNYYDLKKYDLSEYKNGEVDWKFNDKIGMIGINCIDNSKCDNIFFHHGDKIDSNKIKISSRSYTRIGGLPYDIDLDIFISACNGILNEYRLNTKDVFLTSFKGIRDDGKYRRRIDFKTIRCIMNKCVSEII